jgi:hypothetical protein
MIKEKPMSIRDDISMNDCGQYMIRLRQELRILEIGPLLVGRASIRIKEIEDLLRGVTFNECPMPYLSGILVQ